MQRKYLEELGIKKENINLIMRENGKDIEHVKEKNKAFEIKVKLLESTIRELQIQNQNMKHKMNLLVRSLKQPYKHEVFIGEIHMDINAKEKEVSYKVDKLVESLKGIKV